MENLDNSAGKISVSTKNFLKLDNFRKNFIGKFIKKLWYFFQDNFS